MCRSSYHSYSWGRGFYYFLVLRYHWGVAIPVLIQIDYNQLIVSFWVNKSTFRRWEETEVPIQQVRERLSLSGRTACSLLSAELLCFCHLYGNLFCALAVGLERRRRTCSSIICHFSGYSIWIEEEEEEEDSRLGFGTIHVKEEGRLSLSRTRTDICRWMPGLGLEGKLGSSAGQHKCIMQTWAPFYSCHEMGFPGMGVNCILIQPLQPSLVYQVEFNTGQGCQLLLLHQLHENKHIWI